jgi:hypothetical protein
MLRPCASGDTSKSNDVSGTGGFRGTGPASKGGEAEALGAEDYIGSEECRYSLTLIQGLELLYPDALSSFGVSPEC